VDCDSDHEETELSTENYDGTILPTPTDSENTCGSVVTFGSIVGGHDAKKGAYPFIAALGYKNTKNEEDLPIIYACGGSLINRRYIVTAGVNLVEIFIIIDSLVAKFMCSVPGMYFKAFLKISCWLYKTP